MTLRPCLLTKLSKNLEGSCHTFLWFQGQKLSGRSWCNLARGSQMMENGGDFAASGDCAL